MTLSISVPAQARQRVLPQVAPSQFPGPLFFPQTGLILLTHALLSDLEVVLYSKPLEELDQTEVGGLLVHLNLGQYRQAFAEHGVTGPMLVEVLCPEDLSEVGMTVKIHARTLIRAISNFKTTGVPLSALTQP